MKNNLDFSEKEFNEIISRLTLMINQIYQNSQSQKGYHNNSKQTIENFFNEPLPQDSMDIYKLFDEIQTKVIDPATGNFGPNLYAYVTSGGNQISTIAEFIMATINQNNAKWHLAPSMTEIEKRVVAWTSQMLDYLPAAGGVMVSGGSEANLAGLTVARNIYFRDVDIQKKGLYNQKKIIVYCSNETHNCLEKSISLLGIGTENIRRIDTNNDFTLNIDLLEKQILEDIKNNNQPFCVIGNAGTVNTGAIDDFVKISAIAKKYKLWFHIDGAYGIFPCSLTALKDKYNGIKYADSIALDFHKWLYQPFEVGCVLVKNWDELKESYFKKADYLKLGQNIINDKTDFNEYYFQLSRNAKAFKIWMSLKAYGFKKFQQMIQKDIDLAKYLSEILTNTPDFEVKSNSLLGIVCFRYVGNLKNEKEIEQFNMELNQKLEEDGNIFIKPTLLKGTYVLRACIINHRKQKKDIDFLVEILKKVINEIKKNEPNNL